MATVVLKDVKKIYPGNVEVVHKFNLEIADKEFIVFVGPSGCGKSTTLRMVAGLEEISAGTISIDGEVVNDLQPKDRHISMVFQNYALYPHLTVYDNVAYPLKLLKFSREEIDIRVREMCASMGIDFLLTRKPKYLSLGQQQRVAIARALVKRPDIIMMDEPLSNLDKDTAQEIRELIKEMIKKYNATCIYVSHNITDCLSLADNIFVMDNGKIIGKYSPQEFLDSDNSVISALKVDLPHEEESK